MYKTDITFCPLDARNYESAEIRRSSSRNDLVICELEFQTNPSIRYLACTIRLLREAETSIWPLKIYPWLNLIFWNPWEYIG